MSTPDGAGKVTLHKQDPSGLVSKAEDTEPLQEKQEDPEELTSADFQQAADRAQAALSGAAQSVQEGTASLLGGLQSAIAPKTSEQQDADPEVQEFREAAAEAAGEAKGYMEKDGSKEDQQKS